MSGPFTGYLPPSQLKSGLNLLGSNLTDREFEYLLEKVGRSHDGKISLSEFDKIINSASANYERSCDDANRNDLKLNSRHSKSFDSSDIIQRRGDPQFDLMTESKTGRDDTLKWGSLKRLLQSKCAYLPQAFHNIAQYNDEEYSNRKTSDNTRNNFEDSRGRSRIRVNGTGSGRDLQLQRSKSLDNGGTKAPDESHYHTSQSLVRDGVYGKRRYSTNSTAEQIGETLLPINQIKNVLSDLGVQLGSEDAIRLDSMLVQEMNKTPHSPSHSRTHTHSPSHSRPHTHSPSHSHTRTKNDTDENRKISLDDFCNIVGIPVTFNAAINRKGKRFPLTLELQCRIDIIN